MSEQIAAETSAISGRVKRVMYAASAVLVIAAVLGVWQVIEYVDAQKQRDIEAWYERSGIVAHSRAAAVDDWVEQQYDVLRGLAQNQSLQLYMTELVYAEEGEEFDIEPAEKTYLRNLVTVIAERAGFAEDARGADVPANVSRTGVAGIALTDVLGKPLVRTAGMPPPSPKLRQAMAVAAGGGRGLYDLHLGATNEPTIGMAVPIYAVQDETEVIGVVVGLKLVGEDLFSRLDQPGETLESAETYLVREVEDTVEFLSPLADGSAILTRSPLSMAKTDLASAFVIQSPGAAAIRTNYDGIEVLVTGRKLARAPWYLVRTVPTADALTEIQTRSAWTITIFIAIIGGIVAAMVIVWFYSTSVREAEAAEKYRVSAQLFTNVTEFLRVVTDNLPNPIFAVDGSGRYTFANMAAAKDVGMHPRDMMGKMLSGVMGAVRARLYQRINDRVIDGQEQEDDIQRIEGESEGETRILRSMHLPIPATALRPAGALVLLDDLTEISAERDRRERVLRQLVQTLMAVVDRRDPYSANHSARAAEVSRAIAEEMGLAQVSVDTVDIAASLINLGKVLVPRELLTKTDDLTEEERDMLRQSVQSSADLLEGVEFDGPVVATIRQAQERWAGDGPQGVAGEDIEISARILAVANTFVGMVSARAYRDPLTFERACSILQENTGSAFDRRPVSALVNILDNRGGNERWAPYSAMPEADA